MLALNAEHNPKSDKLTGDFMHMAQESEILNKKLTHCQDEVCFMNNRSLKPL
jgi:hypothetical protein